MNCCRQAGKSQTAAILAVHTAVYEPGSHIPPDIPYADELRDELAGYTRRMTASGVSIFENGSRDAPHDDLVFALMLGLFVRTNIETCRAYAAHS